MKDDEDRYVKKLLDLYLGLPQTPTRVSRHDRRLAQQLHQRRTPLEMVESALLLATARRLFRDPTLPPLQPIRFELPKARNFIEKSLSEDTRRAYTRALLDFFSFVRKLPAQVTVEDVIAYRDDLVKKKRRKAGPSIQNSRSCAPTLAT